jgi:hypothetical protein
VVNFHQLKKKADLKAVLDPKSNSIATGRLALTIASCALGAPLSSYAVQEKVIYILGVLID